MNECSACRVDYFHEPNVRVLFSVVCDHRVCEPCVKRLYKQGRSYPCPACAQHLNFEDFVPESREFRSSVAETEVRKRICGIFCKTKSDFPDPSTFDDYLEEREDMIFRLTNPSFPEEPTGVWKQVEVYRQQHAEHILRCEGQRQRKFAQKVRGIILEEGTFSERVNADWGQTVAGQVVHPLEEKYRDLLAAQPAGSPSSASPSPLAALAPQPLAAGGNTTTDRGRWKSGGGYAVDTCRKKARHFFFVDVAIAAKIWPPV